MPFGDPLKYLGKSFGKYVLLKISRGHFFRGILTSFDEHLNIYLRNASEIYENIDLEGDLKQNLEDLGDIVVRGSTIREIILANRM